MNAASTSPSKASLTSTSAASPNTSEANRAHNRARLIRGVEDAIHRRPRERDANADGLHAERLDDPALDLDLANRPLDDVIEEICRDLGVAIQGRAYVWRRRTPEDVASLRARAEAPAAPAPHLQLVHRNGAPAPKNRVQHE